MQVYSGNPPHLPGASILFGEKQFTMVLYQNKSITEHTNFQLHIHEDKMLIKTVILDRSLCPQIFQPQSLPTHLAPVVKGNAIKCVGGECEQQ